MAQENVNVMHAMANVTASANGGAVKPTFAGACGFNNSGGFGVTAGSGGTHSALGVYVLVLDAPVDAARAVVHATARSVVIDRQVNAQVTNSGQTITCTTSDGAGNAVDTVDFNVTVELMPNT